MREHQVGQDRSVKNHRCGRMEVNFGDIGCSLPLLRVKEKTRDLFFDPQRGARFGETTPHSHQANHRRVPQPREKPACSKTPLHAAKKLPTCQPLWQPLLARLRAPGREEATTALLTSLADRSAAARRAVTTAKPPARVRRTTTTMRVSLLLLLSVHTDALATPPTRLRQRSARRNAASTAPRA